ncbi:cupin domain-containing protein [Desulfallas sp. Bu1-1]|uniref:cupin domain-containing protein n=1 Tax=Desulfallas sp. Bu1-1 TaxID=2787620 RepID=UPI00189D0804|nr:cupin domain-containing protein [Desulfallas sp. Bu1-1]MBF7083398.1 cupin domain-containing protein [Desulfallas sp. Bu1-1]MBF7084712.1 cupin domain-containing protein [Desulfallas sp. Bu1-1]
MAKPELEFFDHDLNIGWRQVEGAQEGIIEKILSEDPETGDYTRLLKFPPGMTTTEVLVHDFWEEVYILKGSLYDINKKETYIEGMYACRPPGMKHGPYEIPNGCMTLEIRYYKK